MIKFSLEKEESRLFLEALDSIIKENKVPKCYDLFVCKYFRKLLSQYINDDSVSADDIPNLESESARTVFSEFNKKLMVRISHHKGA